MGLLLLLDVDVGEGSQRAERRRTVSEEERRGVSWLVRGWMWKDGRKGGRVERCVRDGVVFGMMYVKRGEEREEGVF